VGNFRISAQVFFFRASEYIVLRFLRKGDSEFLQGELDSGIRTGESIFSADGVAFWSVAALCVSSEGKRRAKSNVGMCNPLSGYAKRPESTSILLKMGITEFKQRCDALLRSRTGRRGMKGLSLVFTIGLVVYLARQLGEIGWGEVFTSIPRTPWFYLLYAGFYLCAPLCESVIFRLLWDCPARRSLPALIKKRVYSRYLLDYSGEAYLYLWARRSVDLPDRYLLHGIKDNIIISSSTSLLIGMVVLLGLLYGGQIALPERLLQQDAVYVAAAAVAGGSVVLLGIRFRRRLLSLSRSALVSLVGLHALRLVGLMVLQVMMWATAVPSASLKSWLSLLSIEVVISRIPFLPSRDFVFMGTGLEVSGGIGVALPALAGVLLTISVLEKLLNLVFFAFFSFVRPDGGEKVEVDPAVLDEG